LQNGNTDPERKHDPRTTGADNTHIPSEALGNEEESEEITASHALNGLDMLTHPTTDTHANNDAPSFSIHGPASTAKNIVNGLQAVNSSSPTLLLSPAHVPESTPPSTSVAASTNELPSDRAAFDIQGIVTRDSDVDMKVDEDSSALAKINGNMEQNRDPSSPTRPWEYASKKLEPDADLGPRILDVDRTADVPTTPMVASQTPIPPAVTQDSLTMSTQYTLVSRSQSQDSNVPTTDTSGPSLFPAVHITSHSSPRNEDITSKS
jgi:hypothetical protein